MPAFNQLQVCRITGNIKPRIIYSTTPTADFLAQQAATTNRPGMVVLYYQGATAVDITDRVKGVGTIYRESQSKPGQSIKLMSGDVRITLDNTDGYFDDQTATSILYGREYIRDDRVEIWLGFHYSNILEVLRKANMTVVYVSDMGDGSAEMQLRDVIYDAFSKKVGQPDSYTGEQRPLEYPTVVVSGGTLRFRSYYGGSWKAWQDISITAGTWGKQMLAFLLAKAMNANSVLNNSGGITFAVTFDEQTKKYTIETQSDDLIEFDIDASTATLAHYYGLYADHAGATSILSDTAITSTVTLIAAMTSLLTIHAGISAIDLDPAATLTFNNLYFSEQTISYCLQKLAEAAAGVIWCDPTGTIVFRLYASLPSASSLSLDDTGEYSRIEYRGQDKDMLVRRVCVTGKFTGVYAEAGSVSGTGSDLNIDNELIETSAQASILAATYLARYSIKPSLLTLDGEFLPSLDVSNAVLVYRRGHTAPILANIFKHDISPDSFKSVISASPNCRVKVFATKADWDGSPGCGHTLVISAGSPLEAPTGKDYLHLQLMQTAVGRRIWEFDAGATAKWIKVSKTLDLDSRIVFEDRFDTTGVGRYTVAPTDTHQGTIEWDSTNKQMLLTAMADDTSTILLLDSFSMADLLGEAEIQMIGQHGDDNQIFQFVRYLDVNNSYYAFARTTLPTSPRLRVKIGGAYQELFLPDTENYFEINQWQTAKLQAQGSALQFQIDPDISLIAATDSQIASAGQYAAGIRQGLAYLRAMTIRRLTASAGSGWLMFSSSPTGAVWSADYTEAQLNAGSVPDGRYIRVKFFTSRATQYDSYAVLYNIALNYILA